MYDPNTTGNLTASWNGTGVPPAGSVVTLSTDPEMGTAIFQVTGTFVMTLQFEQSVDNINWFAAPGIPAGGGSPTATTTSTGQWQADISGSLYLRVRCSAYTSGTAAAFIGCSQSTPDVVPNNDSFVVSPATSRSANFNVVSPFDNLNHRGVALFITVTSASGLSMVPSIQGVDPANPGTYSTIHGALPAITANGTYVITLYPGVNQSIASYPATISNVLPRKWQVSCTVTGSATVSIAAQPTI